MTDREVEQLVTAIGQGCADGVVPTLERVVNLLDRQVRYTQQLEARVLQLESLAEDMRDLRNAFYPSDDEDPQATA